MQFLGERGQAMTSTGQTERPITFLSKGQPAFLLEGIVHEPVQTERAPVVVLCHPQPASSDMNDSIDPRIGEKFSRRWYDCVDGLIFVAWVRARDSRRMEG